MADPRMGECKAACKPSSVFAERRTAAIHLGLPLPTGSSGQPGAGTDALHPLFGLAPDGVCLAPHITAGTVSSYLAFSPLPATRGRANAVGGRYVSVALSVGSPRPAVSGHPVRWSSDFPLPLHAAGAATARPPCVFIVDAKHGRRQLGDELAAHRRAVEQRVEQPLRK